MTIRLCCACRKISVSRTVGRQPLRSISLNGNPGPTGGSWSGSPTRISRFPLGMACSRWCSSSTSTMDISSTITASHLRGLSSSRTNTMSPVPGSIPASSSRWMVEAFSPVTSVSRFAARPVGAASRQASCICPSRDNIPFNIVVLPVPGPPVISSSPEVAASRMARVCSSEYSMPLSSATLRIMRSKPLGGGKLPFANSKSRRLQFTSASYSLGR